ncbi:MAG: histidine kinase, gyrase and HSP90-like ATPase family protein [Micavibrio sp.]|nr:histidine kinase, gyrase and HSP90-like ATPase family protein [Micavibrio sp.]
MAGKPEAGKIKLNSWHEGGHIIIEIADDGKGLPLDRIRQKIVENRLATEDELDTMSTQEIQQFIFHAGFSTAEKITSVSGRGVGMDVVMSNIQKISGSIEMKSIEGKGTTFTIKIPLTLAIVSALIVGIGEDRFAIPQLDVRELVMISQQSASKIETVNGTPLYRLRDRLLPLIDLRKLLKMAEPPEQENAVRYITAIRVGAHSFGLIVDKVFDTEEIVVKPVTSLVRHLPVFSGNTILGDGHVIMILDPSGIMNAAGIGNTTPQTQGEEDAMNKLSARAELPLLLFEDGDITGGKSVKAVPLNNVSRLEEIDMANVERANGQAVIQYRDSLMPIYRCDGQPVAAKGRKPVIVFSTRNGLAGLIVNRIFDITNYIGEVNIDGSKQVAASVIVQGHATDIINLDYEKTSHPPAVNTDIDVDIDLPMSIRLNGSNGHNHSEVLS